MALIKCKECGKEISDKAESCPFCGYNLNRYEKEKSSQIKRGSIVSLISCSMIILLVVGFFLIGITAPDDVEHSDVSITVELTSNSIIDLKDIVPFGISLILTVVCLIMIILFLTKKIKNVKVYKVSLLLMSIIQLICGFISIGVLVCCGMVYVIFPIINVIGAIIVATGKN